MAEPQEEHAIALSRLEKWIASTKMNKGDRFPAERDLCETLDVSAADLRKAMAVLEMSGAIDRKAGHGAILAVKVSENVPLQNSRDFQLLTEQVSPQDAAIARLALEPELCSLAAAHATTRQLAKIKSFNDEMKQSKDWSTYEKLDARFHALIARSSNNSLLFELYRIVNAVRVAVVSKKRRDFAPDGPPKDYHSFMEHDIIIEALESRDRSRAHSAMRTHLKSLMADLIVDH